MTSPTISPAPGSSFGRGETSYTATAVDASGNTASCSSSVTVFDSEPPSATSTVEVTMLWPPDGELYDVGFATSASDNCDGSLPVEVTVFSNEPDLGEGWPAFSPDARDIASQTLRLRSERAANGNGRVYLIVSSATDGAANANVAASAVVVSKSLADVNVADIVVQAAEAVSFALANEGQAPAGFVRIGDGPLVGRKQ